ncbi:POK25 protein, partial [Cnemophilus loriae]|nr:POK25 protein [Cnemophilus loriae]
RGCTACQLWQSDVTHVLFFGWQKFVHCSIDLFSGFLVITTHTGESAKDVRHHFLRAFATMVGRLQEIHTDNDPAYQSSSVATFLQAWSVCHSFGIAHNSGGCGTDE